MNYLTEAFVSLEDVDNLTPATSFDATPEGLAGLKDVMDDVPSELVDIIDSEATTPEELQTSYIGQGVLECPVCKSKIFKPMDAIRVDEETGLANADEECPYCFMSGGFNILGKIVSFTEPTEEETTEDVDLTVDTPEGDVAVEGEATAEVTDDDGEKIVPLDGAEEANIKTESDSDSDEAPEKPAEVSDDDTDKDTDDEERDVDFEDVDDDIDDMVESYLRESYGDVKSYKTSKAISKSDCIMLEGVITYNNGRKVNTTFKFSPDTITPDGKVTFLGENMSITRCKKPFVLRGSVDGKKLVCESLDYRYVVIGKSGHGMVKGTVLKESLKKDTKTENKKPTCIKESVLRNRRRRPRR